MKKNLAFLLISFFIVQTVFAQCTVNGETVPCDEFWSNFGVMFIFLGIFLFLMTAFWIWMFIDCTRRNFKDKLLWIIILLIGSALGAVLYYFIVKRKNVGSL